MDFNRQLKEGKVGESIIAEYMKELGYNILPVYENTDSYKGPTVYSADGSQLVSPDMIAFNNNKIFWIEAKHKSAFTWHRISKRWVTGIDLKHYNDYLKLSGKINFPLWLMFLHKDGKAKDTPEGMESPTGLYGGDIRYLAGNENHRSDKWAKGMVYWAHDKLKVI